jgi:excisionase family DNA binding protein
MPERTQPSFTIPAVIVPQADGSYWVRPGRPVFDNDWVTTRRAAKMLGLSQGYVRRLVEQGLLKAERPGKRWLRISLASVLARKEAEV